jgi:hypothetical protein
MLYVVYFGHQANLVSVTPAPKRGEDRRWFGGKTEKNGDFGLFLRGFFRFFGLGLVFYGGDTVYLGKGVEGYVH